MLTTTINFRLALVCATALSAGLSIALISLSKLALLLCAPALLLSGRNSQTRSGLVQGVTPVAVLAVLLAFALSLLWSLAPTDEALGSVAKYGKLLVVAVLLLLIRDRREAMVAFGAFALAQLFLLGSSWLLYFQVPLPWATSNMARTEFAVFSSYLDQGIIGAVFAALCWHLRSLAPGRLGPAVAVGIAIAALGNVLFVLSGRSGHVVAIVLLSLAIMWELPRRYRAVVVALPLVLAAALFSTSDKVRSRLTLMATEIQAYTSQTQPPGSDSSSGIRLGLWRSAAQIISEHPLAGAGVGSWSTEYNRVERQRNPAHIDIAGKGNPHQEYLQWGVQLGLPGIALFVALLLAVLKDSLAMPTMQARALQSALAGFGVACLFNSSLYDAMIGDFFCITLGLLLALGLRQPGLAAGAPAQAVSP